MTIDEASRSLGLSYRQVQRLLRRFRTQGDAGLVHRLATQNSYVISHGQPDVNAMKIMFVDSKTGETIEVHSTEVAEAVKKAAEQAGFKSVSPFMEVEGEIAQ